MRTTSATISFLLVLVPCVVSAQTAAASRSTDPGKFSIQAAGGPTLKDPGSVFSASAGFSPERHVDLLVNVERIHQPTQERHYSDGSFGVTRGGTLTFVSGEVRAAFRPPDQASPYLLAGLGAGISEPNVNAQFPASTHHNLRAIYAGAGFRVPLGRGLGLSADARLVLGIEDETDGLAASWPARLAVVWRF